MLLLRAGGELGEGSLAPADFSKKFFDDGRVVGIAGMKLGEKISEGLAFVRGGRGRYELVL